MLNKSKQIVINVWNSIVQDKQKEFENKIKEVQGEHLYHRILKAGEIVTIKGLPVTLRNDVVCYSANWEWIERENFLDEVYNYIWDKEDKINQGENNK